MKLPNTKALIIIAGVILVVLVAITIFVNSLVNKNQSAQQQPTLIPTGIFEQGGGFQSRGSQKTNDQSTTTSDIAQEGKEKIMSEEETGRLTELKNRTPIDSADFTISYSPDLGEFFVQTKTSKGEEAFRQYMSTNQLSNVLENFPELFNIGTQSIDQLIKKRENEITNQNQKLEEQLAETEQQKKQKKQKEEDLGQQQFINLMQTFFSIDTTGNDLQELNKILNITPSAPSGGQNNSGGGGGGSLPPAQTYNGSGTPQLKKIMSVVKAIPGITWGGICVTSGHTANSEHYYCNAVDLFGSKTLLDSTAPQLADAGKNNELPIHCVIYNHYVYEHEYNFAKRNYTPPSDCNPANSDCYHEHHIHVSGWPTVGGGC